jgi:plastocyanin
VGTRWRSPRLLSGMIVAAALAAGVGLLTDQPAAAASTRHAELTVTGVATDECPTGGTQVFVKPGDTVVFTTSLAGMNLGALSGVKVGTLSLPSGISTSNITGFRSQLVFSGEGAHTVSLDTSYTRTFGSAGTYNFAWTAQQLDVKFTLLGLSKTATVNLSTQAPGVAASGSLSWNGQVVVSDRATQCGLSVQVPSVSVSASAAGHTVPPLQVPGPTVPTIPLPTVTLPKVSVSLPVSLPVSVPGLPLTSQPGGGSGGGSSGQGPTRGGDDGTGSSVLSGSSARSRSGQRDVLAETIDGQPVAMIVVDGKRINTARAVEPPTASGSNAAARLPVGLVFVALMMLSTGTATYSRRFVASRS